MPLSNSVKLILLFTAFVNTAYAQPADAADTVVKIDPPLHGYYAKYLDCDGIAIRSANVVDDRAFYIASAKIKRMLYYMSAAKSNLIKNGAEFHIIGKDQQTSDLPEYADQKGVKYMDHGILTDVDKRTRGMGGIYASCGEENLLKLPEDRYSGYDVCVHEFAHTLMNYGLDSVLRKRVVSQYKRSIAMGLWKGAYAAENADEYWADLSIWYFGAHGDFLPGTRSPEPGPDGLRDYDPEGYTLVASIYSGIIEPQRIEKKISMAVTPGLRSGISTEKADLVVINNRDEKLKLYWIDVLGKPQFYTDITAHNKVLQPTYMSHVWMIADAAGNSLLHVQVNNTPCEVIVNKP